MRPLQRLVQALEALANSQHCLFAAHELRVLLPNLSCAAFKTLLSRAVKADHLIPVCRGLYLYKKAFIDDGLMLFHAAAKLRADCLNYISLETVLSEAGVISQLPINRIFLMSSGRSNVINCGTFGAIEFVHTNQTAEELVGSIVYDNKCKLWRATVAQALRDMRVTRRSTDLIDWSVADEFI